MNNRLKRLPLSNSRRYTVETTDDFVILSDTHPLTEPHVKTLIDVIFQTENFKSFALRQINDGGLFFDNVGNFFKIFEEFFYTKINSGEITDKNLLTSLNIELESLNNYRQRLLQEFERYLIGDKVNKNSVFWPNPTGKYPANTEGANLVIKNFEIIDKNTPIGSAGSCFADEMAYYFQKSGYNYIITEKTGVDSEFPNSSAAWGVLFNTPSFMQIAERAFGEADFPPVIDKIEVEGQTYFHDPYRENCVANDAETIHMLRNQHMEAARKVFETCEVFVITLGLNECFQNIYDGTIVSRNPKSSSSFSLLNHKILTVEENIQCLQRFLDIIRTHNPDFKLIVTVSPVPFLATGRADEMHVITANTHSKAVLRVAAEEFSRKNENVWYFPAYEVVTVATRDPWEADLRHVKRGTVARVMRTFERMFVKGIDPRLEGEVDLDD